MRADQVLVDHHHVLRGLLRQLVDTTDDEVARRRQLLDTLVAELFVHTQIEDEIFYPAVRDVSPLLSQAHAEHRQIDEQLAAVMRTPLASPEVVVEARMLLATVHHHTQEEELGMFVQAQALGPQRLEELGGQLQARQRELEASRLARMMIWLKQQTLRRV